MPGATSNSNAWLRRKVQLDVNGYYSALRPINAKSTGRMICFRPTYLPLTKFGDQFQRMFIYRLDPT